MTGPISVQQGSVLSCILYSIYTLDFPEVLHQITQKPEHYNDCKQPAMTNFVDDASVLIKQDQTMTLQDKLNETMKTIEDYLLSNRLAQNTSKTKLMVLSKDKDLVRLINYPTTDKEGRPVIIKHQSNIRILGVTLSNSLKWDHHIKGCNEYLICQLKHRLSLVKIIAGCSNLTFARNLAGGLINGKITYMLELWGATSKSLLNNIQKIQDQAVKFYSAG